MNNLYNIPTFKNYLITMSGEVFNHISNTWLTGSKNTAGYHNFRLTNDDGIVITVGRHRLLAIVFIPIPEHVHTYDTLSVNHINGIKSDDRICNLEWVTSKENYEHAGSLGLTSKCLPLQARINATGDILEFPSFTECGKYFGITKDTVSYGVSKGPTYVSPDGLQFRQPPMLDAWPNVEIYARQPTHHRRRVNYVHSKVHMVHLKSLKTGDVYSFERIIDAANFLSVGYAHIVKWLRLHDQPVVAGLFLLQRGEDICAWREVEDPYAELLQFGNRRVVRVTSKVTGNSQFFESVHECSTITGMVPNAISNRIRGRVIDSENTYEYYRS